MKIRVLPSSVNHESFHFAATYVINETVAIDAGCLGFAPLKDQKKVRHVFLSHAHLDHICTLPIFIDNVYTHGPDCPNVYASDEVIGALRSSFFNDRVWPDLDRLSREYTPFARFLSMKSGEAIAVDGLTITPIDVNHVVPCFGFIVEDAHGAIAIVSDTGPTEEVWAVARKKQSLQGVFLECAFPNSYEWLAEKAKHLTPNQFFGEYEKLGRDVEIIAIHIKPTFYEQVVAELESLGLDRLHIAEPNRVYEF